MMEEMDEFLKEHGLVLIYNHAIYFEEFKDTAYGVLAEDTNYMIRNLGKYKEITTEAIEENLELLKKIVQNQE